MARLCDGWWVGRKHKRTASADAFKAVRKSRGLENVPMKTTFVPVAMLQANIF